MKRVSFLAMLVVFGAGVARAGDDYVTAAGRGARLAKLRKYPQALAAFQEAVRADPTQVDAYLNAGNIARHLNRCREVLLMFRGFLYLAPQDPEVKTARAALAACEAKGTGSLTVKTDAAGIEVLADGGLIGRTPLLDIKLAPGTYQLVLRHPDYEEAQAEVTIKPSELTEVNVPLRKKVLYGFLEVKTDPPEGVTVYLDEVQVGVTPLKEKLKLETRQYFLRLEKPGYDRWIRNVTIKRDRTQVVQAKLEATTSTQGVAEPSP